MSYVSGRTDVLCALFVLSALLAWRRARTAVDRWAIATAVLVLAALACKETAVLTPLVLLVPDGRDRAPRPWLALAVGAVWLLGWMLTAAPSGMAGLGTRLPAVAAVVLDYVRLLVWPHELHLERFVVVPGRPLGVVLAQWAAVVLLLVVLVVAAVRTRALAALALVVATYLPASGIVPVYPPIADRALFAAEHFLYLPLCGLVPLAVLSADRTRLAAAVMVALLVVWTPLTVARNRDWRDESTLFADTLRHHPPAARVWYDAGNHHLASNDPREAERLYREALKRAPRDAAVHLNLGIALQRQGRRAEATEAYTEALRLDPSLVKAFRRE